MNGRESLAREMAACASILITGVVAIVVLFIGTAWWMDQYETPRVVAGPTMPACEGDVITVVGDQPIGCDVRPPQTITVMDITLAECLDMGGEPIATTDEATDDTIVECDGVDY